LHGEIRGISVFWVGCLGVSRCSLIPTFASRMRARVRSFSYGDVWCGASPLASRIEGDVVNRRFCEYGLLETRDGTAAGNAG